MMSSLYADIHTYVRGQFTTTLPRFYRPSPGEGDTSYCCVETDSTDDAEQVVPSSDPDIGLSLRPSFVARLRRQAKRAEAGDLGTPLEEVLRELSLT